MAISLIQTVGNTATGANTSLALVMGNTTTGNSIIIAIDETVALNSVSGITDSQSNSYVRLDSFTYVDGAAATHDVELWWANNITGGTTPTITIAHAASNINAIAREYSNIIKSPPIVKHATGSSTTPSSGPLATTRLGDLIVGYVGNGLGSTQTFTAGTGFGHETDQKTAGNDISMEDQITTTTFGDSATMTLGTTSPWGCGIAIFREIPNPVKINSGLRPHPFSPGLAR